MAKSRFSHACTCRFTSARTCALSFLLGSSAWLIRFFSSRQSQQPNMGNGDFECNGDGPQCGRRRNMFLTSPLVGRAIAFTAEVGFPKDRPAREGPWGQGEDV